MQLMKMKIAGIGLVIGGVLFLWASWSGGVYLNNWSTAELVGRNFGTVFGTVLWTAVSFYMIYLGSKKAIGK